MSVISHRIVVVGGGTAGITVAASLKRHAGENKLDITIIEPSSKHYYQPAFTLVGAGCYPMNKTFRDEQSLIPAGVNWIKDSASSFDPKNNQIKLASGELVDYDFLVVCPGLESNWGKIKGAQQALGKNGVCSNYSSEHVSYTWDCIQSLKPGDNALFTQAPLPFKCPGAPQKIAYLAADYLKKKNILKDCKIHFLTHGPALFAVPLFAKELQNVAKRYGIQVHYAHNLVSIDSDNKKANFEIISGDKQGDIVTLDYDILHFTPPQSPPDAIKSSPLANEAGYVDIDQGTMRHNTYDNVFALGDAGSTPNSKTAAAVRKQSPVVVNNLISLLNGKSAEGRYDGYGSCPLTTAYDKVIMAEFIYAGKVTPTFPLDPRKERRLYWWIKVTGLPIFYWNYMLKGYEWFFKHRVNYKNPSD